MSLAQSARGTPLELHDGVRLRCEVGGFPAGTEGESRRSPPCSTPTASSCSGPPGAQSGSSMRAPTTLRLPPISSADPVDPRFPIRCGPLRTRLERGRFRAFPTSRMNARVAYGCKQRRPSRAASKNPCKSVMGGTGLEPVTPSLSSWYRLADGRGRSGSNPLNQAGFYNVAIRGRLRSRRIFGDVWATIGPREQPAWGADSRRGRLSTYILRP